MIVDASKKLLSASDDQGKSALNGSAQADQLCNLSLGDDAEMDGIKLRIISLTACQRWPIVVR